MAPRPTPALWKPEDSLVFAQASTLLMGLGLAIWSLAPAIVERIVTGQPPTASTLLMQRAVLLLGAAFLGLCVLIRKRIRWAVWTAFGLSALLVAIGVVLTLLSNFRPAGSFILLFSGFTCFACWLAIGAVASLAAQSSDSRPSRAPARH